MKFIADIMVGKLARYLRMAGNDVVYNNGFNDEQILNIAESENRIILTRDRLMLKRRKCSNGEIKSLLINDDKLILQLIQVKNALKLKLAPNLIRCLECNTTLENKDKQSVKHYVPPYVFKTRDFFLYCPLCSRYYWRGTHYNYIEMFFNNINSAT